MKSMTFFGQDIQFYKTKNNVILNKDTLKRGLYYSLVEFKNNNPSDTNYLVKLDNRTDWDRRFGLDDEELFVYDESGNRVELENSIWGFYNGEDVFIFHERSYCEIHTYGRYCIYTLKPKYPNSSGKVKYDDLDYFIDIQTGDTYFLNSKNLREYILFDYPILLEKFDNETMQESMYYWYVNEVNSRYRNQ